jgi:hypothetical protein
MLKLSETQCEQIMDLVKKLELISLVTNTVIKNDTNSLQVFLKENNLENLSDPFNKLVENFILEQEEIDVSGYHCKIEDSDISHFVNLKKINASNNTKITNLNRFKKLTEINIGWSCDSGICELENLLIINASFNIKIKNLVRSTA